MATSADKSPVTRIVRVQEGNRWVEYVARITGEGVYIRQKGKRTEYGPVSWGAILHKGAVAASMALRLERLEREDAKPVKAKRASRNLLAT